MPAREIRRRPHGHAVRITTAAPSRAADIAARQRRYLWSMAVRTVCFVGAVVAGPGWLRWALVVAAIFLPYVAVVMANAADQRSDDFMLTVPGERPAELPASPERHAPGS